MANNDEDLTFDLLEMEKWLENYFLDPLTSYLDQTQFRIDLYETEKNWIIEALLNDYEPSEITVFAEDQKLIIKAVKTPLLSEKTALKRVRTICLPFTIIDCKVTAAFRTGILEVMISKTEKGLGKNRFITLP